MKGLSIVTSTLLRYRVNLKSVEEISVILLCGLQWFVCSKNLQGSTVRGKTDKETHYFFYVENMLPELMTHRLQTSSSDPAIENCPQNSSSKVVYCICQVT